MKRYYVLCKKVQFKKKPLVLTSLFAGKFNVFLIDRLTTNLNLTTGLMVFILYILKFNFNILIITGFHKPTTTIIYSTIQPKRCSQNDAPNDAIAKRNFPKFYLRSTNLLFKLQH